MAEGKKLVIVESPTKMRSIQGYLGDGYEVLSSVGHIRDLADKKDIPAEDKQAYGKYSIDIDNGFDPYYVVSDRKTKTVAELKRALKTADELLLATDEDREGEAIAWHLLETLKPKVPVKRMVFHEITKDAIQAAVGNTRELDHDLVDAQETRRILDRLYGWDVSPVLWYKVKTGISAGRVQSAATRLIVDRERERMAFVSAEYWDVDAAAAATGTSFKIRLVRVDGGQLARGTDFDDNGKLKKAVVILDEARAAALAKAVDAVGAGKVTKVEAKPGTRSPYAPFTTSTMQQEAGRKLSMGAKQAMGVAQRLYEKGYITYMRTDSTSLSTQAVQAARSQAVALYGDAAVPLKPRVYKSKSKNAQEAHEAIRPSGETFRTPASLSSELDRDEQRLYDLIWKRTVASQMADAKYETTTVTIAVAADGQNAEFTASGTVYTFKGFLEAYEEGRDEKRGDADAAENQSLPAVAVGDELAVSDAEAKGHRTNPKPRYTEASLVKVLEEKGIGRPSTFASIPETILDRGYAVKRGQALVPTWLAFSVVRLLEEHFAELVDYDFTAALEDDLDTIARGEQNRVEWLKSFYFGSDSHVGLRQVVDNLGEIDARALNSTRITDTATLRFGKYGPYLEVTDPENPDPEAKPRIVNVPEDLAPDELTAEKAQELIDAPVAGDRVLGENPENGKIVVVKDGRFGPYVQENDPVSEDAAVDEATGEVVDKPKPKRGAKKETAPKPRTASLFRSMSVDEIDLDTALRLLSLPRVVGVDPESGDEITAQNGRFGPYLKKGADSRSLESESQIFDVTLEQALEIYAQPKYGAGRKASSALAEFEADPVSGKPIRIRDGRFGAYVTDSETNVTIPRGQTVEDITFEIAVQMLADKRAKGPAPKRGAAAKKAPAKKAPAKKPAAKKPAAKTATAKKAPAKKATAATSAARSAAAKKAAATRAANAAAKAAEKTDS
ncbi:MULTISPECIES: type I DNA topoisomerase [unclassified Microbacterium]|uniref:type I DNA topoisomerase n=1 Tax=unclassified Microbacterium TaxID=2609290 RepID=UPI000CFB3CBB|nr:MULTISPECIES: type I DNA topoisomerase [unclassified Microbacterium]PQZ52828.1 DNA topoisomerase I [Microbacterium sp. MYb43]PQZ74645.1 DNA topoisomerase I [Microbacterium sp. MYb40]PRB19458.1 DNA topoisomerase I [Microbacterium sp. MYb54]PRB24836.1 DNA topoisomerase I [Microbacterium sp. MYb50]PRB62967.1 DNA topoisomerase I [Microbacterium sp. MYb24]